MECNMDEAVRAKGIAEEKYKIMDFEGAKRFALKAQALFPALEGISQMITTFSIYVASMVKVAGENDWYSILSVPKSVDDETLKKQYRKLLFQIHPDKNKSVGANGAIDMVYAAWKVLSDKQTRALYDQKLLQQQTPQPRKTSDSSGAAQKFHNFAASASAAASAAGTSKQMAGATASEVPQVQPQSTHLKRSTRAPVKSSRQHPTFWTSCSRCYMQFEYCRKFLNLKLLCIECNQSFLAIEKQMAGTEGVEVAGDGSNISGTNPRKRRAKTSVGTSGFESTTKKMKTMAEDAAAGSSSSASGMKRSHRRHMKGWFDEDEIRAILVKKGKVAVEKMLAK
ncbi:unnamed protein product [Urochloa humidicola]